MTVRIPHRFTKSRSARWESGLSLIEVLMSVIVISVGILGLAPLMTLSISGNEFAMDVTSVAAAAQQTIEQKMGQGSFPQMPYADSTTAGNGRYAVLTRVKDNSVDASVPNHIYQIDVTVNWRDDTGDQRTLTFTTYSPKS